ncbi:MAG TPA: hypothetical protein VIG47_09865 [Gemmatimonadaceae bacterium]|jgi:hypothetical protein
MLAAISTDAFRIVLGVFGLLMLFRMARLLWRLRRDPPEGYVGSVALLGILTGVIGAAALVASVFPSPAALWTMAAAVLTLPVSRAILRRRHQL